MILDRAQHLPCNRESTPSPENRATFVSMAASLQTADEASTRKQLFIPPDTFDHPFNVTLVVEDGKEVKALSEASPFFEKLLKSDMKESNEGVVRLEMLTEPSVRDVFDRVYLHW